MSKLIVEAITEHYGERCPDYDEGCFCCKVWKEYDALIAPARCDELVTTSSINGTLLVTRQNAEEVIAAERLKLEATARVGLQLSEKIDALEADNAAKDKLIQSLIDFDSEEVKRLEADNAAKDARIDEYETGLVQMHQEMSALEADNKRLREALEPFANVAEHDIGDDEDDGDIFWPMRNARYSMAGRLRVGDLRRASAALGEVKP